MKVLNLAMLAVTVSSFSNAFTAPSIKAAGRSSNVQRRMFNFFGSARTGEYPIMAEESAMKQRGHGTSEKPVQKDLRWNCDNETADRICKRNVLCKQAPL
jgi:hypothetical protein